MHEHLLRKGWSTEEIGQVKVAYQKLEKQRTLKHHVIDWVIFVLLLGFAVTLNATFAILIVPLFFFFPVVFLAVVFIVAGLTFGVLFSFLSKDLRKGHSLFMVCAAIFSLLAFGLVLKGANEMEQVLGNPLRNTFLYAAGYILCFIIPFILIHPRRTSWT
jgi:hypothetical protein